jgi:lysophospholipase L1-like esterase
LNEVCAGAARSARAFAVAVSTAAIVAVGIAPAAQAAKPVEHAGPTTAVELGDSYMAGTGNRWLGNSLETEGNRGGTDRACAPSIEQCESYEFSKVYSGGACEKSDVAQINSAKLPSIEARVNLACGAATAKNIRLSSNGGEGQNGEPPQADQLLEVAKTHNVKFIVIGIGGNDVNFGLVLSECAVAYLIQSATHCNQTQEGKLSEEAIAPAKKNISEAVADVKSAMSQDGYRESEYTIALEDLVSLSAPNGSEIRYPEAGPDRIIYGCPMYNDDFEWLQSTMYPKITAMLKSVAQEYGLPLLEMQHAFAGHEICSKYDSEASATNPPTALTMEWGRPYNEPAILEGGEVWHPDAYGGMAQGGCLGPFYTHNKPNGKEPGDYACYGAPGREPAKERLVRAGGA